MINLIKIRTIIMALISNTKHNSDLVYIPDANDPSAIPTLRLDMKDGVAIVDDQAILDENNNSVPIECMLIGSQTFYGVLQEYPTRWLKLLIITTTNHEVLKTKRPIIRSVYIRGDGRKNYLDSYRKATCDNVNIAESIMKITFVPRKKQTQTNQTITTKPPAFNFTQPSADMLNKIKQINGFLSTPDVIERLEKLLISDEGRNLVVLTGSNDSQTIREFDKSFNQYTLSGGESLNTTLALNPAAPTSLNF
jgi:hypothetical protein